MNGASAIQAVQPLRPEPQELAAQGSSGLDSLFLPYRQASGYERSSCEEHKQDEDEASISQQRSTASASFEASTITDEVRKEYTYPHSDCSQGRTPITSVVLVGDAILDLKMAVPAFVPGEGRGARVQISETLADLMGEIQSEPRSVQIRRIDEFLTLIDTDITITSDLDASHDDEERDELLPQYKYTTLKPTESTAQISPLHPSTPRPSVQLDLDSSESTVSNTAAGVIEVSQGPSKDELEVMSCCSSHSEINKPEVSNVNLPSPASGKIRLRPAPTSTGSDASTIWAGIAAQPPTACSQHDYPVLPVDIAAEGHSVALANVQSGVGEHAAASEQDMHPFHWPPVSADELNPSSVWRRVWCCCFSRRREKGVRSS